MIVGNEAAHIEHCLRSFAGSFHELCIVQAIGAQEPDETVDLAHKIAEELGVEIQFGIYKNGDSAKDWRHVDNFAAARNQAFELATGDWIFWADADDTLRGDPAGIIETCAETKADLLLFTYDVPGTNKAPWRERCIRRSLFEAGRRWQFAVHENLILRDGDKRLSVDAPVWVHSPVAAKPRSHDRNLRILSNALREAGSQLFYVHQEHFYARSEEKAREFGLLALGFPNLHETFRFEIIMNLGRLAKTPKEALEWFGRGVVEMPQLREPLAGAVLAALEGGEPVRALELARRMVAIPVPPDERRPWTFEAKWYRWHGRDLLERCERLNGLPVKTENYAPKITLLHATRNRPQKAWECREKWMALASEPDHIEYIMAVDSDDKASRELAKQFRHVVVEPGSCVRAWNAAARMARGEILIQLSDDFSPPQDWDATISKAFEDILAGAVLAVSDGNRKDSLLCMAILNRERLEAQGDLFFEGYESVFSDNEFSHRAWADGVVIDRRADLVFEHAHPFFGKGELDATYQATNAPERYERGRALFIARNPDAVQTEQPDSASLDASGTHTLPC
jgi:glycosyltransferase involved in cell wall biosynthesis